MPTTITISFEYASIPAPHGKGVPVHFGALDPIIYADFTPSVAAPYPDFFVVLPEAVALDAAIPRPVFDGQVQLAMPIQMDASVPAPVFEASLFFDILVFRGVSSFTGNSWQKADFNAPSNAGDGWDEGVPLRVETDLIWNGALQLIANTDPGWEFGVRTKIEVDSPWQVAEHSVNHGTEQTFQLDLPHHKPVTALPWQVAAHVTPVEMDAPFTLILPHRKPTTVLPWGEGVYLSPGTRDFTSGVADRIYPEWDIPWNDAVRPPHGSSGPGPVDPPVEPPVLFNPGFHDLILHFICPNLDYGFRDVPVHFGLFPCNEANPDNFIVPTRTLYMIYNQISMKRVDDDTPIEIVDADIASDKASWCWTFKGTIPAIELDKVMPDGDGPVEVEVTINTVSWRFLIETYDRRRTFGDSGVTITGRSLTAKLDAPYSPVRNYTSDAEYYSKALAQMELDRVPGPTWGLDWPTVASSTFRRYWDADDGLGIGWTVPEKGLSYSGLTPMAALNLIAASVGAYVQSHKTDEEVIFNSGAPKGHWDWAAATPDIIIPKSILLSDGLAWEEKPQYSQVIARGGDLGISGLVRRTAFTPTLEAPAYINNLITAEKAAHEVGKTIISSGGKQARVTIEVPLDPVTYSLGAVNPGMLVKVTDSVTMEADWWGLVQALGIKATATDQDITVRQSIQLERHY